MNKWLNIISLLSWDIKGIFLGHHSQIFRVITSNRIKHILWLKTRGFSYLEIVHYSSIYDIWTSIIFSANNGILPLNFKVYVISLRYVNDCTICLLGLNFVIPEKQTNNKYVDHFERENS